MEIKRTKERKVRKEPSIMPRSTMVFLLVLAILASILGYNYFARPFTAYQAVQTELATSAPQEEAKVEPDKERVTTQDLAQLLAFSYLLNDTDSSQSAVLDWVNTHKPGVVTLFGSKITLTAAQAAIEQINSRLDRDVQPLMAVDHEGGSVQRLSGSGFTSLPSWQSLCVAEAEQRHDLLTASAQQLSQTGIDLVFAPVVDLAINNAVLKNRICASDPTVVTQRAVEFIDIFAQQHIMSVIKHYPGIGHISRDPHRNFDEVDLSDADILVFKNLLEAYPLLGVMSAHVGVVGRYEDQPCSLNLDCVDDLTDFVPQALVFTDALDMNAAGYIGQNEQLISLAERAVMAIKAGNDVLVFGPQVNLNEFDEVLLALKNAYESDEEFRQQAEKSVRKIRQYKEILRK